MKEKKKLRFKITKLEVAYILVILCSVGLIVYAEKTKDRIPPVITIKENNLFFYDTDEINFLNYVDISDDSNYVVNVIDEESSKLPGERQVQIEAEDSRGNISNAYLDVKIISTEEWKKYVADNTNHYEWRRKENEEYELLKGVADYDAFHLAETFIGMPGGCNEVAQAFINAYFGEGHTIYDTYSVSKEDALPGDVIYYVDGGLGLQHWAVYLGGASALQGNIYGTTVLGSVYMNYGSEPQFNRINGK